METKETGRGNHSWRSWLVIASYATLAAGFVYIFLSILAPVRLIDVAPRGRLDMNSSISAIGNYEATYDRFPLESAGPTNEVDNAKLMAILTAATNDTEAMKANPERTHFLEPPTTSIAGGAWLDPWKHPYHFILRREGSIVVGGVAVPGHIAIWSNGRNGVNEYGKGDDRVSW